MSPRFLLFSLIVTLGFALGCQHTAEVVSADPVTGPKLDSRAVAYVAVPPDAFDGKRLTLDSGRTVAVLVRDAMGKHAKRAYLGRNVQTYAEALETAQRNDCQYLVYPTILRWEDRATEFSGLRDKAEVKIEVADAATGKTLHSAVLRGAGRWMTSGGDTPIDIVRESVAEYVASLFQLSRTPSALPQ